MSDFSPDALLRRSARVGIEITGHKLRVSTHGEAVEIGRHALAILDTFAQPRIVRDVLSDFAAHAASAREWVEYGQTLALLYRMGALEPGDRALTAPPDPTGYAAPSIHIRMLNDRVRTAAYIGAIKTVVRSGDVVVDIGTGTGVLAIAAAKAGARRVFAIEANSMIEAAAKNFLVNRLGEIIQPMRGWSTHIETPELADVIVSELLGDDALAENVLEIVLDARNRLAKPGARIVPSRLRLFAVPVIVPDDLLAQFTFTPALVRKWQDDYDIDLSALVTYNEASEDLRPVFPRIRDAQQIIPLGEPVCLSEIDFRTFTSTKLASSTACRVTAGRLDGVLAYFEAELAPGKWISTAPHVAHDSCHWRNALWLCPKAMQVESPHEIVIDYAYSSAASTMRLR